MGPYLQVSGKWEIVQKNGFRVNLDVRQEEDRISAFASHSNGAVQSTDAVGRVHGPNFELTITWNNGTKGLYTGIFTRGVARWVDKGFLKGRTKDLNHPGSESDWDSEGKVFMFA